MGELSFGTRIRFGSGALEALKELAGLRVLVVSDRFLAERGFIERVTRHLSGSEWRLFDQVAGEPDLRLVAKGVAVLEEMDAQAIVAFGGGSAMDCAKAIGYCGGKGTPLWCIPTTAGTGSEVTTFSVLTDSDSGTKSPLVDPALLPAAALLDGEFLKGVPAGVTADTGMDVLTHAAEAYIAIKANPFTDALAEKAFAAAFRALPKAYEGDEKAREEMLLASTMAGMAFNTAGLGVCHGLAHALGARLHQPHGRINGALLPLVMEANAQVPEAARKYGRLAQLCGLSANARALSGAIRRLARRVGIPERLEGPLELDRAVEDALKDPCTADNPRTFTAGELTALLRTAVQG